MAVSMDLWASRLREVSSPYFAVLVLEGLAVMGLSIAICGAAGVAAAVLEERTNEEIARWGYWGTTVGFVFGVPLTLVAFVLLGRNG